MSAATGLKQNNVREKDGLSWEDEYVIDAGGLTSASRTNFFVKVNQNPDGTTYAECLYKGSGALTIAEFNNLPIGSRIFCPGLTTPVVYLKTAASTWKYQAINT
jgi:hypothetical protein